MNSMTGFGRGEAFEETLKVRCRAEISSVNKKQSEVKIFLPRELSAMEIPLRNFVLERLSRGMINLRIEFINEGGSAVSGIDFSVAKMIYESALNFQKENNIPGTLSISDLLAIPDAVPLKTADYSSDEYMKVVKLAVGAAIRQLLEMRSREGAVLAEDLKRRIGVLENTVNQIEPLAAELPKIQIERLRERLGELKQEIAADDERILREAVIFADKLDVAEELTRLHCHFDHFRKLTASTEPVGRSLDFLVQEIFRECNTLGNKAASTSVSPLIVTMKTELEKIREQVQNIE